MGFVHIFFSRKLPSHAEKLFQNPCLKLWLSFARDHVSSFQACIGQIEKSNISATEVAITRDVEAEA